MEKTVLCLVCPTPLCFESKEGYSYVLIYTRKASGRVVK